MTEKNTESIEIEVSSRILRHMSRGIYRTPAAALKELASNSHDAGATRVSIKTGYPVFEKMVITDDGSGIQRTEFKNIVKNIGISKKNAGDTIKLGDGTPRQIIGHYGIGLLAVGQLAAKMRLSSKKKGETTGFFAELDFDQFEKNMSPDGETSRIKDEAPFEHQDKPEEQKFKIGKCDMGDLTFDEKDKNTSFTKIELTAVREEVKRKLAGRIGDELNTEIAKKRKYFSNFNELLKLFIERENAAKQGQYPYEKLCLELAIYCPLQYPEIKLFNNKLLSWVKTHAENQKFSLVIDGITLKKPYEQGTYSDTENPVNHVWKWENETYAKDSSGKEFKVSGFFIWKPQVRPKLTQGVLIREAGVAIGLYDSTFMEYPFDEGFKFKQITGEIFAQGLSGALNIDRNSFNETDDRYLALAKWLHTKLQSVVFPHIKRTQKGPSSGKRELNRLNICEWLQKIAKSRKTKITSIKFGSSGKNENLFRVDGRTLVINQDHHDGAASSATSGKILLAAYLVMDGQLTPSEVEDAIKHVNEARN